MQQRLDILTEAFRNPLETFLDYEPWLQHQELPKPDLEAQFNQQTSTDTSKETAFFPSNTAHFHPPAESSNLQEVPFTLPVEVEQEMMIEEK